MEVKYTAELELI